MPACGNEALIVNDKHQVRLVRNATCLNTAKHLNRSYYQKMRWFEVAGPMGCCTGANITIKCCSAQ